MEWKDPTKIVEGDPRPPKGMSGILRPEDSDCSGNNVFAFLWEPLCVVGKQRVLVTSVGFFKINGSGSQS